MLIKNRFNHNNKVKTVLSLNIISNHNFSTFIKDLYPIFFTKSIYFFNSNPNISPS